MPDTANLEIANLDVEVFSDGGAQRLLSLRGLTYAPAVGDTMSIGDRHYQVRRRHWCVGDRSGGGYGPSVGTVEIYVRAVRFDGSYGRRVGRPNAAEAVPE